MKRLVTFFFFACLISSCIAQQIVIRCRISIHNSCYQTGKIAYVKGAAVSAAGGTPGISDDSGHVAMAFVGLDSGDAVRLNIAHPRWAVVNRKELQAVMLGRRAILNISMADTHQLAMAQVEFYQVSKTQLFHCRDSIIQQLKGDSLESQATIAQLELQLGITIANRTEAEELLNGHVAKLEMQLPELAATMAETNLDYASESHQQAFRLYKQGKCMEAMTLLKAYSHTDETNEKRARLKAAKADPLFDQRQITLWENEMEQTCKSRQLLASIAAIRLDFHESAAQYEEVIQDLLQLDHGDQDLNFAVANKALGVAYGRIGQHQKALAAHEEALKYEVACLGEIDPRVADTYSHIASAYEALGNTSAAIVSMQKVINIQKQVLPSDEKKIGDAYLYLGDLCMREKQYQVATSAYLMATPIISQHYQSDNLRQLYLYKQTTESALRSNNFERARDAQKSSIQIQGKLFGNHDPSLIHAYQQLACIYDTLHDYNSAILAQQNVIQIRVDQWGISDPKLAESYVQLAGFQVRGRFSNEALATQEKAIVLLRNTAEPDTLLLAEAYAGLGAIQQKLNQDSAAKNSWGMAMELEQVVLAEIKNRIAEHRDQLQALHSKLDPHSGSVDGIVTQIEHLMQSSDIDYSIIIECYQQLALAQLSLGRKSDAVESMNRATEMLAMAPHPRVIANNRFVCNLATILFDVNSNQLASFPSPLIVIQSLPSF